MRGSYQKSKLLYLIKILSEETDEKHGLTMPQIIEKLAAYGSTADRKTVYLDFEELRSYGVDVVGAKTGKYYEYRLASRQFELPELKLLVDSVQAAKFITEKKSRALIKKLVSLASRYEAKELQRQVLISGRVKTMNESIYYNVDKLHAAINNNTQIRFKYRQWNIAKEQELRRDGKWYRVSPWYLVWQDEYYYLVGYEAKSKEIRHYRVDKMTGISETGSAREGKEQAAEINIAVYSKALFGMFTGDITKVTFEAENQFVGILIDRFGKDIPIIRVDEGHFRTSVELIPSKPFIGWLLGLGKGIRVTAPESVVADIRQTLTDMNEVYLG